MTHKNTICLWYDKDALEGRAFLCGNVSEQQGHGRAQGARRLSRAASRATS